MQKRTLQYVFIHNAWLCDEWVTNVKYFRMTGKLFTNYPVDGRTCSICNGPEIRYFDRSTT